MGNGVIEVLIKILENNDTINEAYTTTLFQQQCVSENPLIR